MILTHPQKTQGVGQSPPSNRSRIIKSRSPMPHPPPNQLPQFTNQSQNQPIQNSSSGQHQRPRHVHKKSFLNPSFIGAILAILALSIVFAYEYIIRQQYTFWIPVLLVFLFLFIMTQWSYINTVCTHPGRVPAYYGMSSQLTQQMPRKYCLLCHNFKPQRTHHCSTCQTCVLNMDHHCPWVNNCVGFVNRKYFILFLIYITLGLVFMSIVQIIVLINAIKNAVQTKTTDIHLALKIIIAVITLPLTFMLAAFTIFHFKMVLKNTTTLEGIISRKGPKQGELEGERQTVDNYNIGKCQNFKQVFGENPIFWGIPILGNGPKGNGTYFPKPQPNQQNSHYRTRQEYEARPLSGYKSSQRQKANSRYLY